MSDRNRLEDLKVIPSILDSLVEFETFDIYNSGSFCNGYEEWWEKQNDESRNEIIRNCLYCLVEI